MGNLRAIHPLLDAGQWCRTDGRSTSTMFHVTVPSNTVGQVVDALDARYPGIRARLCEGDALAHAVAVSVDGRLSRLGLLQRVGPESEIRFLPAVEGG